jgi:hypothetical protein
VVWEIEDASLRYFAFGVICFAKFCFAEIIGEFFGHKARKEPQSAQRFA